MAFLAAGIIRMAISKRARVSGFMTRLWIPLLLAIAAIAFFRSFSPLMSFFRDDLIPNLHHSALTILNTQPLLFLLLNSIIFAVLAPSGLFTDSTGPVDGSTDAVDHVTVPADRVPDTVDRISGFVDRVTDTVDRETGPDPKQISASDSGPTGSVSPAKARVKRKKMQKSASATGRTHVVVKAQIAVGIVQGGEAAGNHPESARNRADSLKDEDFKQLIDSYIAHAREQMIKQERASTTARSRV